MCREYIQNNAKLRKPFLSNASLKNENILKLGTENEIISYLKMLKNFEDFKLNFTKRISNWNA